MSLSDDICMKKDDEWKTDEAGEENKKEFVVHRSNNTRSLFGGDMEITQVVPHLLLGSIEPALDHGLLKERQIKHVLSLGLLSVPQFEGITYNQVRIQDDARFNLKPHLEAALDVIEKARSDNQNIFVHCQAGVSRSPAVIIAYLMRLNSWTYNQAFDFLKNIRPSIQPNHGFVKQLIRLESNTNN